MIDQVNKIETRSGQAPWWLVLPSLSLLTFAVMLSATELGARLIFSKSRTTLGSCLNFSDTVSGARGVSNAVCIAKAPEDPKPIEYRFNSAGFRGEEPARPAGSYRIVTVGSSIVMGYHVAWNQAFVPGLGERLSKATGHPVDVYAEGLIRTTVPRSTLHFQEIQALQPNMILLAMTPWEVENSGTLLPAADPRVTSSMILQQLRSGKWAQLAAMVIGESRSNMLGDYFFFSNRRGYLKQALAPGSPTEYLQSNPAPAWQKKLNQFDKDFGELADKASASGIPLVVTVLPRRAQAAMISQGSWPPGFDPYLFGRQVKAIAERHHATYVDILHDYAKNPDPEAGFLLMDGHLNGEGHSQVATYLAQELVAAGLLRDLSAPQSNTPQSSRRAGVRGHTGS